ncbi:hypothetical protein [Chryseobacterium sp.]|uniref:hypothetical protein n=1 Tax=Chryseobacterium sp. TaxID=1871047 RepID=UPI0025B7C5CB|nr:hypothetical protein [Chryseobacterium sp.]MBV8328810.1 hypothetical protein [Chryseobacterium sp.]
MSEEKVIIIRPDRKTFEDIYFSGNQGSLLFSPTTKSKTITTTVAAVILCIAFLIKDSLSKDSVGILYFLSFIFLLCAIFLSVSINKVSRWKKQVDHYLNVLEKCKVYEIRIDSLFFTVSIDGNKENSEWKDFEYFDSNDQFITLEGKYSYMFPKKAMNEKDYNFLKKIMKENVNKE